MSISKRKLRVTPEEIARAKKVSMTDLLSRLGFTWKEGQTRVTLRSPLRKETNPSFFVFKETNTWYDFGADEGGDTIKFIMKLQDCGFQEAVTKLCAGKFSTCDPRRYTPEEMKNERITKIAEANSLYEHARESSDELFVRRFFREKGVRYYPQAGPVTLTHQEETYIAIPCPFPGRIQSLECRSPSGERKTFGRKIPWILRRDTPRIPGNRIDPGQPCGRHLLWGPSLFPVRPQRDPKREMVGSNRCCVLSPENVSCSG